MTSQHPSVRRLLQQALAHHQAGRLDAAERLYREILARAPENADALQLLNYEALCDEPQRGLRLMADAIDTRDADSLIALASTIRAPRPRNVDTADVPASVMQEVDRVYTSLKDAAMT